MHDIMNRNLPKQELQSYKHKRTITHEIVNHESRIPNRSKPRNPPRFHPINHLAGQLRITNHKHRLRLLGFIQLIRHAHQIRSPLTSRIPDQGLGINVPDRADDALAVGLQGVGRGPDNAAVRVGDILHDAEAGTDSRARGDDDDAAEDARHAEDAGDGDAFDVVIRSGVGDGLAGPVASVGDEDRAAGFTSIATRDAGEGMPFLEGRVGDSDADE
jgi:hypothetical protein